MALTQVPAEMTTGYVKSWTTATRPSSPSVGLIGYNTTIGQYDIYTSGGWVSVLNTSNTGNRITAGQTQSKGIVQMIVSGNTVGVSGGFQTTSLTPVSIGASVSITPIYSTSTIVYMASLNARAQNGTSYYDIYVNGTQSAYSGRPAGNAGTISKTASSQTHWQQVIGASFAPNTTSTQTYDLRMCAGTTGETAEIWNYGPVNIVVYEVAA